MMLMAVWMWRKRVLMSYLRLSGVTVCLLAIVGVAIPFGVSSLRSHLGTGHAIAMGAALGALMILTGGAMRRPDGGVWEQRWGALTVAVITQVGFLLVSALLIGPKWLDVVKFVGVIEAGGLAGMGLRVLVDECRPWRESDFLPIGLTMLLMGAAGSATMISLHLPMWMPITWSVGLIWMVVLASKQIRYRILRRSRGPANPRYQAAVDELRRRAGPQRVPTNPSGTVNAQAAPRRHGVPQNAPSVAELNALLEQVLEEKAKKDATLPTWFDKIMKDD